MSKLNSGFIDYNYYVKNFGRKPFIIYVDGGDSALRVASIDINNKCLNYYKLDENNELLVINDELVCASLKPKSFKAYAGDELIVEW